MSAGEHTLTRLLRLDPVTLAVARGMLEAAGADEAGMAAVRRYLDTTLRAAAPWPSEEDYTQAADDFARAGRTAAAELLRHAAAAGKTLDDAEAAWRDRYANRAPLSGEALASALRKDTELVSWDPAGPYRGIDGAEYQPGAITLRDRDEPVAVVSGRGTQEAVTGWRDFAEMAAWIAGRGTGGSGALTPPPVATPPRAWLEDLVLARIVTTPSSAAGTVASLRPDTMTTDVRFDVFAAVRAMPGRYTPDMIADEAVRRLAYVPRDKLAGYGAPPGAFVRAYVARLAETDGIGREEFREAMENLRQEDRQAAIQKKYGPAAAPGPRAGQTRQQEEPAARNLTPGPCPDLPPEHGPRAGYQDGPVPGL